jgi:tannase/feruloyl esterase
MKSTILLCCSLVMFPLTAEAAASCETLRSLKLPNATISAADVVAPGAFPGPATAAGVPSFDFKLLPAFCRVQGIIAPSADSHVEFEVWLPTNGWNGKFEGVGNGGFAGTINYADMAAALSAGYATASTDTGHKATGIVDAQWAAGHPEKLVDFGYRAIHETAERAKTLIRAFYGESAAHSYFSSCSNGGRQALMEAQRFPADYDGIIAGAPAANFTAIAALFVSNVIATSSPAAFIPRAKYAAIEAAVVTACDARDGVKDGIVSEPKACAFDPTVLRCTGTETDACLTVSQIASMKKLYAGLQTPKGAPVYPGFVPGGESGPAGWGLWLSGPAPDQSLEYAFGTQFFAQMVYQNRSYDYRTFAVDRDLKAADDVVGNILNATNPDLSAFEQRGGKLIVYHGWSDAALPPTATIDYQQRVVAKLGQRRTDSFMRTYMVPGMQHCGNGPGADSFGALPGVPPAGPNAANNMSAALERWVEQGTAPSAIIATKYKARTPASGVALTRPLCPYPEVARYKGTGNVDEAKNFVCSGR